MRGGFDVVRVMICFSFLNFSTKLCISGELFGYVLSCKKVDQQ